MKRFWATDWFLALAVGALFLLLAYSAAPLMGLERTAYDLGARLATRSPGDDVLVVAIDQASLRALGPWPWPRDLHAEMIQHLKQAGARVIGYDLPFDQTRNDPVLKQVNDLIQFYAQSSLAHQAPHDIDTLNSTIKRMHRRAISAGHGALARQVDELYRFYRHSGLHEHVPHEIEQLGTLLRKTERKLNMDRVLADAISTAGNVVLPMELGPTAATHRVPQLPAYAAASALNKVDAGTMQKAAAPQPLSAVSATAPLEELGKSALGLGNAAMVTDFDGAVRTEPLVVRDGRHYYPSLALELAARYLGLNNNQILVRLGKGVHLGKRTILTDSRLRMRPFFYAPSNGKRAFTAVPFHEVLSGKVPATEFRNKLVLVGPTAKDIAHRYATPVAGAEPAVMILASTVASVLNEHYFTVPSWSFTTKWLGYLLILLYLMFVLPRLRTGIAAILTLIIINVLVDTQFVLMINKSVWLPLVMPAALLVLGHAALASKRALEAVATRPSSDADSAESNRMLGLAFQGQGQLDMAFEKFRKCPLDEATLAVLYNLALDYERKRQYAKAGAVYQHMAEFDPHYKDLDSRMARARKMEETGLLAHTGPQRTNQTLALDVEGLQKPMLGRYQVERIIGKGAMGVIYQGRDPKINRVVAIKTLALAQEFDEDERADVQTRFFREAETAGRLNHPNIVTIYDAGEEQDLAYIAMEYLTGHDLTRYTKPGKLLPLPAVFHIVIKSVEALEYAHGQNVVHRDIKPGNIIFEAKSGEVKITDFGIARITDSSKTRTGTVLGTPAYMSPEQLAGRRIDGRSDLFSLGVMFYQLITGSLPFRAESMASLMFKISNEQHLPAVSHNTALDPCIDTIIDRALEKKAEDRYQSGADMARDLRACARRIVARSSSKQNTDNDTEDRRGRQVG